MYSSHRAPREGHGTPHASNSSQLHPTPTPRSMRPPDMKSSVAYSFAVYTGLPCGRMRMPVPSLKLVVHAARKPRAAVMSSKPLFSGNRNTPSSEPGYLDSYSRNMTICSPIHKECRPTASAPLPRSCNNSGVQTGERSGANNPTFIPVSL